MRALITGASRGLGAEIARQLSDTHHLVLGGRPSSDLDALADELGADKLAVDLTDDAGVAAAMAAVGELDVLVNNAGIVGTLQTIKDTPADEWRRLYDVNVVAAAELTRLFLPALRSRAGHVVFVNSGAGLRANGRRAAYASTKFALRAMAEALRIEEPTLRVTSVYPGRIDTDMQREIVAIEGDEYEPSRYLTPESVARMVVQAIRAAPDAHPEDLVIRAAVRR